MVGQSGDAEDEVTRLKRQLAELEHELLRERARATVLEQAGNLGSWDLVPATGLPVLVFGGELATIFPPDAARWIAAQVPGARLSIFGADEGGSHFLFWENAERFNRELRAFLG